MRVLVACEYSGRVRDAFRRHGHDAMSCDLLPTEAPGPHHQGPVQDVLNDGWDLMVAHPPCTDLAISGSRWLAQKQADGRTDAALAFVRLLMAAHIDRWCIENPVSLISSRIRKPDQIIQPWQFGHGETKATCLWLKNLPLLKPTHVVEGRESRVHRMPPGPDRWKERSRTYEGVAAAMGVNGATWRCLPWLSSWRWPVEWATYPQPLVMPMAWGEWMCPVQGPEHELQLERQRRSIQSYDLPHARDMLWRLAQLCQHQELILRAATKRIAELECREALRD